jgi:arsenate reductase (thioredoxin)
MEDYLEKGNQATRNIRTITVMKKQTVLFLCTGNSCRSQMAEGFLRHMAGDRFESISAGFDIKEAVHPLAVAVMQESGIDISDQKPKNVAQWLGRVPVHHLIIVCDKANATCPRVWPGVDEKRRLYWPFTDPALTEGSEEERLAVFREVRNAIQTTIMAWLEKV